MINNTQLELLNKPTANTINPPTKQHKQKGKNIKQNNHTLLLL